MAARRPRPVGSLTACRSRSNLTPLAIARLRPSRCVRGSGHARSRHWRQEALRAAALAMTTSQSGSPRLRNAAPAVPILSISSSSYLVERPSRSSLVTTTTSLGINMAISLANSGRLARRSSALHPPAWALQAGRPGSCQQEMCPSGGPHGRWRSCASAARGRKI